MSQPPVQTQSSAPEPPYFVCCLDRYPTVCQAVLNTFACYHVDTGSGLYADNQQVRGCSSLTEL